jgi:hypothetical protein
MKAFDSIMKGLNEATIRGKDGSEQTVNDIIDNPNNKF